MNLFDLGRYFQEWQVVLSFFNALTISATVVFVLAVFFNGSLSKRFSTGLFVLSLLALLAGFALVAKAPFQLQKYAVLQLNSIVAQVTSERGVSSYTQEQLAFYSAAGPGPVEFMDQDSNIILLIVESLSSINSFKVSGERDLLRRFDTLSEEGVLFRNFFANHAASEGGIISLLSGVPPLHYPGATPLMFDEFAMQPSVIGEYRQRGYFTEFLTNADLGFIGMDRYISGLNFDRARGWDEVPAMEQAPKIVQHAPSDRYLYAEALDRAEQLNAKRDESGRPWFMAIATVSTHLPYTHPEGGEDTPGAVWAWSLEQLESFYRGLQDQGFFKNGILLISGDHRQMRPLTNQETKRYGDSAKARIPLLVIGEVLPAGVIDNRCFQQSDLLRLLKRVGQPDLELSPQPVWVERYNRVYGKVDSINRFSVFNSTDQGKHEMPVLMSGIEISWIGKRPSFSRKIEASAHAQRSRHQFIRTGGKPGCAPDFSRWPLQPSVQPGLQLSVVQGGNFDVVPDREFDDKNFHVMDEIAFPSSAANGVDLVLGFRTYLLAENAGLYWFRTAPANRACMGIDQTLVLDQLMPGPGTQGSIELEAGLHAMDLRFLVKGEPAADQPPAPSLQWVTPGQIRWHWMDIPARQFRLPVPPVDPES